MPKKHPQEVPLEITPPVEQPEIMPNDDIPHPLSTKDAAAIIGILANLSGEIMVGQLDNAHVASIRQRMTRDGLLPQGATQEEIVKGLGDLVDRIRVALGEYDSPPSSE